MCDDERTAAALFQAALGNGNGSSSTDFTTLKLAVVAPMARASVATVTSVNTARALDCAWRV